MALRVKCKCGKALKISSKFADKKISCPGCKRPFRIPAAKFKSAAAKTTTKAAGPAMNKTAAAAPIPAPLDLDIQPANLDLELSGDIQHSQSDILSDILEAVPPVAAAASKPCPSCRGPIAKDAVICINCGYNLHTGTSVGGVAGPPLATPTGTMGYASSPKKGKIGKAGDDDQISQNSFWTNAFTSFIYPVMSSNNAITFAIVAIISMCRILLEYAGCLGSIGSFCIFGWLAAMYFSVVQDTASGSKDLPGIKMEDGVMEDIVKPAFKYIGATALSLLPAIIYGILMATNSLPAFLTSPVLLGLWFLVGVFVMPMIIMLFAFDAVAAVFRIDLVAVTIFRTFLPYLGLWAMLFLVGILSFLPLVTIFVALAGLNLQVPDFLGELGGGFIGTAIFLTLDVYVTIVSMRLIGLYYLHFKNRFAIVME